MRFIIYGAGAIGGTLGGYLALGGYDVLLVDLPGPVHAIREHGLRLTTPKAKHVLRLEAVAGTEGIEFDENGKDVVFLCVKSQHTEIVLQELSSAVADVPVFCVQNGVRNEEKAAQYLSRVYGVMIRGAAVCLRDGEVQSTLDPPGVVLIGRFPEGVDDLAETAGMVLQAVGYHVRLVPDVMRYKWGKLIRNLWNPPKAITNTWDAGTRRVAAAARAEAQRVLERAGIDWVDQERLWQEWGAPQARARMEVKALGSIWQSLARGGGSSEAEYISGEIVRVAEQVGMDAPINRELTRIVMDMAALREPPGRYTAAELSALLGLTQGDTGGSEMMETTG